MGLLSTKEAANSTPLLITLPILTISFHLYCKGRYEPAFVKHPLQVSLDVATGVQFLYFFSDCQSKSNTQKSNVFRDTLCFELAFFILFLVMVSKFRHSFTKFELILFPLLLCWKLQEAMMKDTLERAREPNFNLKEFLQNAYIHPVFKGDDDSDSDVMSENWEEQEPVLVQTKRQSRKNTPLPSKHSGSLSS